MTDHTGVHESILRQPLGARTYTKLCARAGCENHFSTIYHYQKYCGVPACNKAVVKMRSDAKPKSTHREPPKTDTALSASFLSRPLR